MSTAAFLLGPAGRCRFDPGARTLSLDAQPVALGARALDVLLALVDAGGELVTKEQLLQRCWPGLVVEEANVHVQVSQLRKLLGVDSIATVPGLGYRFAWPVAQAGARAVPSNLPAPRTPLVGREALLDTAQSRLADTRLLTLIGIGGTGKTRLALALARQVLADHADGVWWVDLAPLDRAEQVAVVVAQTFGLATQGGADPVAALCGWLRERQVLLALDNCEHLLDATAGLADDLLAAAPQLKLLVTTREALGVLGEAVFPVAPLALPAPQASAQAVLESAAVRLFADRAAAVGYALAAEDAGAAAEICRRVDGIPLALELAAAQLRVVSPAQLLELLNERFRPLTSQRRALARQQTMQAVIHWSYEHLRPDEQLLLMALATCSGGCDLDAAAALMGSALTRVALLSGLCRLAEQSLLVVQHGHGPARYQLLETVRQFAFERLQEADHGTQLRTRHVAHYLAWAEASDAESQRTGEGTGPLSRIDLERENLLRAIDACMHDDVPEAVASGLRLMAALRRYWLARGLGRLGAELGLAMLEKADGLPVEAPRIVVGYITAYLLWVSGRLDEAHQVALQAVALAEAAGDRAGLAAAQLELGTIKRHMGAHEEGQAEHETACRIALEIGDRNLYADALCRMGNSAAIDGRLQDAVRYFDEALPIRLASGHAWRMAGVLLFAGSLAIRMQQRERARDLLRQASAVLPRVGSVQYEQYLVDGTAQLAKLEGDWRFVVRLCAITSALPHSPSAGPPVQGHDDHARQSLLSAARAALGVADFDKAWSLGLATSIQQALALARDWLGADPATDG